jgi:dihydroneopterin aldolase
MGAKQNSSLDKIILQGIQADTIIGWYATERQARQTVIIDLTIGITQHAGQSDNLCDTIDYAGVVDFLRKALLTQQFFLLEALAQYIAQIILYDFSAQYVKVHIVKPDILPNVARVAVEIERFADAE